MKQTTILTSLSILSSILLPNYSALGAALKVGDDISFDPIVENSKVGDLLVEVTPSTRQAGGFGITASFTTTTNESYTDFLQNTLNGAIGINWLQIVSIDPNTPGIVDPLVEPPPGGLGIQWADNKPWYWDESKPSNLSQANPRPGGVFELPDGKLFFENGLLEKHLTTSPDGLTPSELLLNDSPNSSTGFAQTFNFDTFLIAEYANNKYDIFSSFSWTAFVDDQGTRKGLTDIIELTEGAVFTQEYADWVSAFGYQKVAKLPTYKYSFDLQPGFIDGI